MSPGELSASVPGNTERRSFNWRATDPARHSGARRERQCSSLYSAVQSQK